MKRLKTSLKGIIPSFLFNSQDERFITIVADHYSSQAMSGHRFLAWVINP